MTRNKTHQLLVLCLGAAILLAYAVMAYRFPYAYIWATYEDLYGEWTQFYLFVAVFIGSLAALRIRSRYRWFFAFLALAAFYTFMEEISWGQRILGISSPDFFKARNLQGETNLHNFFVGPYSTTLKQAIEYLVAAALAGYGVVYPLMLRYGIWPARHLDRLGVAAPPLYLWPLFACAAYLELGLLSFNEAEIAEILIGLALTATAIQYAFTLPEDLEVDNSRSWHAGAAARLASYIALACVLVGICAFATTEMLYSTPAGKARTDSRVENGLEKFASRYARYDRWDVVVDLRERLLELNPDSTSTLRALATAQRHLGDRELHDDYLERALAIGLERLERNPESASANRSLARTYRMMGEDEKADLYIDAALVIGLARVEQKPDSASAAYSLGRTYALMGRGNDALRQYQRATELNPTSKKYRKAYLRQKH